MKKIIHWLETHQAACLWKQHMGFDCPGCGIQSAFTELLKGNISESILLYPALIPMIIMILFLAVHLIFRFQKGALILKILFIFTSSLIIISYVVKLIRL
jgi:hypothetical protein